jgi:hypothetical protein
MQVRTLQFSVSAVIEGLERGILAVVLPCGLFWFCRGGGREEEMLRLMRSLVGPAMGLTVSMDGKWEEYDGYIGGRDGLGGYVEGIDVVTSFVTEILWSMSIPKKEPKPNL